MSKRKAPEEDVWFVLQEDGILHTVAKSKKEALSTEETSPTVEYVQITKSEEGEDIYLNPSDNESGIVYEEADDNFNDESIEGDTNDGTGATISPSIPRPNTGCKWPSEAVWCLLDQIEAKSPALESAPPSRRAELWAEIARDIKPYDYSGIDCHKKFKSLKHMYQKLVRRKALDMFPVQWQFFSKMAIIMGDDMPHDDSSGGEDGPTEARSADSNQTGLRGSMTDEERLSRFDKLLVHKKDILDEVRRQGDLLKQYIVQSKASDSRREKREVEMIELMKYLRDQEEQKTVLFNKLLDRL